MRKVGTLCSNKHGICTPKCPLVRGSAPNTPILKERKPMRANTNKLNFYVDDDVKKKLKKLSKESGLTMTAVITKLIMGYHIQPLKTEELLRIYKELNHIGGNINQIAYIANSERHISNDNINEAAKLMNDIWRCVRSYGRNA